jgi:ABC-2 type transport system ATP-binding protein
MINPRLRVERLSKNYGRVAALNRASFVLNDGEVLGLIGPNGAGKTTLFECIAGVLPADEGRVVVDGTALDAHTRGRHLFYLPDGIAPWPAQSLGWALNFVLGFFGGPADRLHAVVDRLDLGALLPQRVGDLSKGQRKRGLLAMAMLTPQPLLLIDEPFDGLDVRQTREAAAALRQHAQDGRSVLLSIHQIADAARVCDRFVLLSAGAVCAEGTIEELAVHAGTRGATEAATLEEVLLALT